MQANVAGAKHVLVLVFTNTSFYGNPQELGSIKSRFGYGCTNIKREEPGTTAIKQCSFKLHHSVLCNAFSKDHHQLHTKLVIHALPQQPCPRMQLNNLPWKSTTSKFFYKDLAPVLYRFDLCRLSSIMFMPISFLFH